MEYQVQINSIKAKLQETRARKKQQEELIVKVENQALKVSSGKKLVHVYYTVIEKLGLHVQKCINMNTQTSMEADVFMWHRFSPQ